jgi:Xaa-Pro aminopeptidase
MDHSGRLSRMQRTLPEHKLDFLLVTHLPNIRYLCGFTGSAGALLIGERGAFFFTDGRYTEQARTEVQRARVRIARKPPLVAAADWLTRQRGSSHPGREFLGIEGEHLTVADRRRLSGILPRHFRLAEAPARVEQARMVKDQDELQLIRTAVLQGARLFEVALSAIKPGVPECEVAAEMEHGARRAGAEGMSFETIIASGKRSAMPHARASGQAIPAQGFVVCDFGVILAGYCSDMTRTVYVGRPSDQARRFYDTVRRAQQAAVDRVAPGVSVGEVDRAARRMLRKAGLARYFSHSTGHGVGLEIHEAPRVAAGQHEVLQPGMVITIEPGAYIPGRWGVRVEDMVVVTETGSEVITPTTKELIAL